jgi:hypothetical protein
MAGEGAGTDVFMFVWFCIGFVCLLFISSLTGKNLKQAQGHFWGGTPRFLQKVIHNFTSCGNDSVPPIASDAIGFIILSEKFGGLVKGQLIDPPG